MAKKCKGITFLCVPCAEARQRSIPRRRHPALLQNLQEDFTRRQPNPLPPQTRPHHKRQRGGGPPHGCGPRPQLSYQGQISQRLRSSPTCLQVRIFSYILLPLTMPCRPWE